MGELTSELERPTLDDKVEETPQAAPPEANQLDELAKMLSDYNVQTPQQLEGKMKASSEAGRLAQLLGEERQRTENYEARLRELETASIPPKKNPYEYDGDLDTPNTVNLEDAITNVYRKERAREQQAQMQHQQKALKAWSAIQSHKDFPKVKEVWEEKLKDPYFVYQIQSGQIDPQMAYRDTVDEYKDNLLGKTLETIETIRKGAMPTPPHVESGGAAPTNATNLVSEGQTGESKEEKRFNELKEKVNKGQLLSPDEEEEATMIAIGKGGPLF